MERWDVLQGQLSSTLTAWRSSSILVIIVVFFALCLDYMLIVSVIPIMPDYLSRIEHPYSAEQVQQQLHNCTTPITLRSYHLQTAYQQDEQLEQFTERKDNQSYDPCALKSNKPISNKTLYELRTTKYATNNRIRIGLMIASTSIVQCIVNPIAGIITAKYGCRLPMILGCVITLVTTIIFAFSETYVTLFIWRALQGVGSSLTNVASMDLVAIRFPNDEERGKAMGHSMSGASFGAAVGSLFASVTYYYFGKPTPFLIMAALMTLDGLLRVAIIIPVTSSSNSSQYENVQDKTLTSRTSDTSPLTPKRNDDKNAVSISTLLRNPIIMTIACIMTVALVSATMLDSTLPIHIMNTMHLSVIYQGLIFLPMSVSVFIAENVFGWLAFKIGRWLCGIIAMGLMTISYVGIAFSTSYSIMFIQMLLLGTSIGMLDTFALPTLALIVDQQYTSTAYGHSFSIYNTAFALGFMIGPIIGSVLVTALHFKWAMMSAAFACFLCVPILFRVSLSRANVSDKETNAERTSDEAKSLDTP